MIRPVAAAAMSVALGSLAALAQQPPPRFTVPDGFAVEEVYAPARSGSIVTITFDADGRLVASREEGPVVRLLDPDGDGRVDEEAVITDRVKNAQGLLFDGAALLVVGNGPEGTGLYRVDAPGAEPILLARNTSHIQEHGPHAVFFGPDGLLYWMLGNHTALEATPSVDSPYRVRGEGQLVPVLVDPNGHATQVRAPGGFVVRGALGEDRITWELVAGGFRNAYDAAFNLAGELFTFDSDMEWDLELPWYRPVRTYHIPPGAEFGWRTGTGLWQVYYPDVLPPMRDVGRGSPTGVAFYQHTVFPEEYRDAFFEADWSRGRILVGRLTRTGATYREDARDFLLGTPLNVTDVETGPDGALYFSKGGRKTEGGIYRVVYRGRSAAASEGDRSPLDEALDQPQPRSAWGRAAIARLRETVGDDAWRDGLTGYATDSRAPGARRARALELLHVTAGGVPPELLTSLIGDADAEVRAAAVYYLGLSNAPHARDQLIPVLADEDAFVRRRACEALVRAGVRPGAEGALDPAGHVLPLLGDPDRFVRYAARELLVRTDRNRWRDAALAIDTFPAVVHAQVALVHTAATPYEISTLLQRQLELVRATRDPRELAALLRPVHLAMAADQGVDMSKIYGPLGEALLARYPSGDPALDREITLAFAYLRPPAAVPALTRVLRDPKAEREAQIWAAYVLRRFDRGWTAEDRAAVVDWFRRTQDERWKGGNSFAGYIAALWQEFVSRQPAADQEMLLVEIPTLGPAQEGGVAPWKQRPDAARISEQELREYLEFDPMAYRGSPEKGREVFEKAFCSTCHRVGDVGQDAGPDLTDVGRRFRRTDLLDAILYPSRTISDQWAAVEFVMRDRKAVIGTVRADVGDAFVVRTVNGDDVRLAKAEIASRTPSQVSAMPEGLLNGLSLTEIRDLLTFLEKGAP